MSRTQFLPNEILTHIFSYLPCYTWDIDKLERVSVQFRECSESQWKRCWHLMYPLERRLTKNYRFACKEVLNSQQQQLKQQDTLRIALFGQGGVGKSSIVYQYTENFFPDNYEAQLYDYIIFVTIRVDFHIKTETICGATRKLEIAKVHFSDFIAVEYTLKDYDGYAIVCSFDRKDSLDELITFMERYLRCKDIDNVQNENLILVINKSDLTQREFTTDDVRNIMRTYQIQHLIECSAKKHENLREIFLLVGELMLNTFKKYPEIITRLENGLPIDAKQKKKCNVM